MTINILVYGWYGKGNIGDELMAQALAGAFALCDASLTIVDNLTDEAVTAADAVIIGGGSILYGKPVIGPVAMELLLSGKRPVFYIGVGTETDVHIDHRRLLDVSRANVVRNPQPPAWMKNAYPLPDLVYSLPVAPIEEANRDPKGMLFVPNLEVIPRWDAPHWSHLAWERFKDETAQFLDTLVEAGTKPAFLLMCKNSVADDAWAMGEIVARMKNRSTQFVVHTPPADTVILTDLMQNYEVVMTQRFHGIILAQMAGVPCVSISHHDKLKYAWPFKGTDLAYHGTNKDQLIAAWTRMLSEKRERIGSTKELYDRLAGVVFDVVDNARRNRG